MLRALVSWAFSMPNRHPAAAAIITGLYAVVGIIAGISVMATPSTTSSYAADGSVATSSVSSNSIALGIAVILVSLVLLGLTIYAAVDTKFFQFWTYNTNGNPSHGVVRWIGPVLLGVSIIASIFVVILTIEAIRAALTNS